ncbi:MAG TPA: rod-binding protein [Nitrobacter sp.]|nr:rod-binding protein [Nitrobacter sp.]
MSILAMPPIGSGLAAASTAKSALTGVADAAGDATGAARKAAVQFEQVFLSKVLGEMFTDAGGDGPLGTNGPGGAIWRSMLTDQFAQKFASSGGVGLADSVQRQLVSLQETGA